MMKQSGAAGVARSIRDEDEGWVILMLMDHLDEEHEIVSFDSPAEARKFLRQSFPNVRVAGPGVYDERLAARSKPS